MARIWTNAAGWKMFCSLILLILCGLPGIVLELIATDSSFPFQRGFFCSDENLRYPIREDTISTVLALMLCLGVPLVTMLIIEFLIYKHFKLEEVMHQTAFYRSTKLFCLNVHRYIVAIFSTYIPFLFASGLTLSLTNALKYMVGRLRPHFLTVCQPDFSQVQCYTAEGFSRYVQNFTCSENTDEQQLLDARLSFPSGHASTSACCFVYLAIYLQFRMIWKTPYLLRPLLQALLVSGAILIAATRVSDYKHFWSDVTFGFFLGAVISILGAFVVSDLYSNQMSALEVNGAQPRAKGNRQYSQTDMSTIVTIAPNYQSTDSVDINNSEKRPGNI